MFEVLSLAVVFPKLFRVTKKIQNGEPMLKTYCVKFMWMLLRLALSGEALMLFITYGKKLGDLTLRILEKLQALISSKLLSMISGNIH